MSAMQCDAVILAGGSASPEMARRTGTQLRALFPHHGRSFVERVHGAVRSTPQVNRIAVVGPPALRDLPGLSDDTLGDSLIVEERETIEANLFAALAQLQPRGFVLITPCDNPLLASHQFTDFLDRASASDAVSYPVLRHEEFLRRFPGASNVRIRLRDGSYIGGGCVLIDAARISRLQSVMRDVMASRKSKARMVRLLGPSFVIRFGLRLVTADEVERRSSRIAGMPVRFVRDCAPELAIDIDDPEDWDYLQAWTLNYEQEHEKESAGNNGPIRA